MSLESAFVEVTNQSVLKKYTEEDRKNHCEAWKVSGLSMSEYSRQFGLTVSSLSKWVNDINNKTADSAQEKSNNSLIHTHPGIEVILVSGIRLRVGRANIAEIIRLIKALESCS